MFRRSSKRAFSSTTQTLCFPFSAASISAGASAESWLVRYTVVFSVDDRADPWRRRARTPRRSSRTSRTDAGRDVARARSRRRGRRPAGVREPPLGVRHPRLVLQVGPVERRRAGDVCEVEQAAHRVDAVGRRREPLASGARASPREIELDDLEPHDGAEPALAQLRLDRLEQVVGVVGDLGVAVAREAERRRARRSPSPGRASARKCEITASSGISEAARRRRATKRGRPSGTLTRAKRSSPESGSRTSTPRLSDRPEMYGNGCPGPTASGVSTG